jgi:hypothetical protein
VVVNNLTRTLKYEDNWVDANSGKYARKSSKNEKDKNGFPFRKPFCLLVHLARAI